MLHTQIPAAFPPAERTVFHSSQSCLDAMTPKDIERTWEDAGLNRLLVTYTDLQGRPRGKLIPVRALSDALVNGVGFPSVPYLGLGKGGAGFRAVPDHTSLIVLPWDKTCGWMAADLYVNDAPLMTAPRMLLKEQIKRLRNKGLILKSGVEPEFYVLAGRNKMVGPSDSGAWVDSSFSLEEIRHRFRIVERAMVHLADLDWGCYSAFNEDSPGQFEINWRYDECLKTADRHTFFKFMMKELAREEGVTATFMPKPFNGQAGSGCHVHMSLWDSRSDNNIMLSEKDSLGLSTEGYNVIGALLKEAGPLTALLLPSVNSYKRIHDAASYENPTACPSTASYGGDNRTHMIRVPSPGRLELRLGDGTTNPYLLQSALAACSLHGIQHQISPGAPSDENLYEPGAAARYRRLPFDLGSAIEQLDKSVVFRGSLGDEAIDTYLTMLREEWREYTHSVTDWEWVKTIDR